MIVNVQTTVSTNLLPIEVDLSDFSDAGEFGTYLYARSRDFGLVFIPVTAHIEGYESTVAVATATVEEIWALHEYTEEHGEAFGKWLSACGEPGSDMTDWGSDFSECYEGEHSSLSDWAQEHMENYHSELFQGLDEVHMVRYFDFDSWAQSELTHDFNWTSDTFGSVFVFRSV